MTNLLQLEYTVLMIIRDLKNCQYRTNIRSDFIAFITIKNNEELEKAIKRFRKQVEKEGIIREWRKREYYEKPSTIKHKKKKAMRRKELQRLKKINKRNKY